MAGNDILRIQVKDACKPGGHYSPAMRHENTLYISGQLPVHADGTHGFNESFEAQARVALANVEAILRAAGSEVKHLIKVTVYVVGVEHWPAFDQLYSQWVGDHRPARVVVPVPELHHGYLLEIEAIARAPD